MKDHYDFSQSIKNPYFKYLQESVTLQLKEDVSNYFTPSSAGVCVYEKRGDDDH